MNKNFMIEELCMEDLLHANPLGAEVHYADQNVALLNNLRNFSNRAIRMSAELSMLLFCREGKVDFTLNENTDTLSPSKLVFLGSKSVIRIGQAGPDCVCAAICISTRFIRQYSIVVTTCSASSFTCVSIPSSASTMNGKICLLPTLKSYPSDCEIPAALITRKPLRAPLSVCYMSCWPTFRMFSYIRWRRTPSGRVTSYSGGLPNCWLMTTSSPVTSLFMRTSCVLRLSICPLSVPR